jgi:hypothetical protein
MSGQHPMTCRSQSSCSFWPACRFGLRTASVCVLLRFACYFDSRVAFDLRAEASVHTQNAQPHRSPADEPTKADLRKQKPHEQKKGVASAWRPPLWFCSSRSEDHLDWRITSIGRLPRLWRIA